MLILHLDIGLTPLPGLERPHVSILTGVIITLIDDSESRWHCIRRRLIRRDYSSFLVCIHSLSIGVVILVRSDVRAVIHLEGLDKMSIFSGNVGIYACIIEPEEGVLASQLFLTHHIQIRRCFINAVLKSTGMIPVSRVWYAVRCTNPQEILLHLDVLWPLVLGWLIVGGGYKS